jgi:hypothetical protein
MSTSYYAQAVIGVEATGKLHAITKRPSCEHRPSGAFCSTCGRPNETIDVQTPIAGYDEFRESIGGLAVVHTTKYRRSFVGIATRTGDIDYNDHRRMPLTPAEIEDLRRRLTEIGLWDESSFGLWAVGCCS